MFGKISEVTKSERNEETEQLQTDHQINTVYMERYICVWKDFRQRVRETRRLSNFRLRETRRLSNVRQIIK